MSGVNRTDGQLQVIAGSRPVSASMVALSDRVRRIHEQAIAAAQSYRRSEALLIDALIEVDREKVFQRMGYSSLFVYACQALRLSESVAYSSITVARKVHEVPALQECIRKGEISISKAKKIASVLTHENQQEWLGKARVLPMYLLEKAVATASPRNATFESARYVSARRLELVLGIDETVMIDFRRAQDQVSRSHGRAVSLEDTLQELIRFFLRKRDPLERSKRAIARKGFVSEIIAGAPGEKSAGDAGAEKAGEAAIEKGSSGFHPTLSLNSRFSRIVVRRTQLPAAIAHAIRIRDQGRCQFVLPTGQLCGDRRWTDFHHIRPVAEGGEDTAENLITLCRTHHREHHRREGRRESREGRDGLNDRDDRDDRDPPQPPELPLL